MHMAPQRRRGLVSPSGTPSLGSPSPSTWRLPALFVVVVVGALSLAAWWSHDTDAHTPANSRRTQQQGPADVPSADLDPAVRQGMPPGHRDARFMSTPKPTTERPASGWRRVASFPHDPAAFTSVQDSTMLLCSVLVCSALSHPWEPNPPCRAPLPTCTLCMYISCRSSALVRAWCVPGAPVSRQGLEYRDGWLWEGTGLVGRSGLRKVDIVTGVPAVTVPLGPPHFGEGITIVNNTLVQITWQTRKAFVYDWPSLALRSQVTFSTHSNEGWGICYDGRRLIVSGLVCLRAAVVRHLHCALLGCNRPVCG